MNRSEPGNVTEIPTELNEGAHPPTSADRSTREAIMASAPVVRAEGMLRRRAMIPAAAAAAAALLGICALILFLLRRSGQDD